jgi:energy-coupling factor transporter ATP-binding protein EcfA2
MLKSLEIKNFTVFEEAKLEFSQGLNVIIGENGTGKTHLLKVGYAILKSLDDELYPVLAFEAHRFIYKELFNIFRPDFLGRLVKRHSGSECQIHADLFNNLRPFKFSFSETDEVNFTDFPNHLAHLKPVFLPTREIVSVYEGFSSALRNRELAFDGTYLDLADALGLTPLKGERFEQVKPLLVILEQYLDGKIVVSNGRFYIQKNQERLEMPLVAEGIRKFAMLAHLLANGSIQKGTSVFWDEPESNLNPKLIRHLAEILVQLANFGVQIFIATHSLFLLRELEIQMALHPETPSRYFALKLEKTGVNVSQGDTLTEVDPITVLDVELEQSDRYLEVV